MGFPEFLYKNAYMNEIVRMIALRLRLYYPYNLLYMKRMRKQGHSDMNEKAIDFFTSSEKRIENILCWLADDKSRDTFKKLINMRQYYKKEDIPEYNYFDQYLPNDLSDFSFRWMGGEVIIDCGAFNGDVTRKLAKRIAKYEKIYAFEPDKNNVKQLNKRCKHMKNIEIIEAACSNRNGILSFVEMDTSGGSYVSNNSDEKSKQVKCLTIDTVINDGRCDFIKMDIEGAEWDALHGARETIVKNKPRLAISIYHSDEDMIRLIEYIHELVPEYRLFIRAHTMGIAETILYAVI